MCLLGSETDWIENFKDKIGRKTFLKCIWLDEVKKKKKRWGVIALPIFFFRLTDMIFNKKTTSWRPQRPNYWQLACNSTNHFYKMQEAYLIHLRGKHQR